MDGDGWQISEVMALLGMGQRAIQRSCGQNPASGDLGIVRVDGGNPAGARTAPTSSRSST